ncbi:TPA: hypothetical protein EYP66_10985 [Candidatus Poribacteria bacterium]|nr:hypothetical protein [Candidatus Poribacteria bacterium]
MRFIILKAISISGLIFFGGCMARIPPKVDLKPYNQIGVISFNLENARGNIGHLVTSKFIMAINKSQRKANLIKIGSFKQVRKRIGKSELDVKAVGDRYEVDAVFTGTLSLSDVEAHIEESGLFRNLKVLANANLTIAAQLISTATGEVLWTNSITEKRKLSQIRMRGGIPEFAANDPNRVYGLIIEDLLDKLTADFRSR